MSSWPQTSSFGAEIDHVRRRRWIGNGAIALVLLFFAASLAVLQTTQRHEQIQRGDRLQVLQMRDLNGHVRQITAAFTRGPRVWIVISPHCPICVRELPILNAILSTKSSPDLTMISIGNPAEIAQATLSYAAVRERTVVDQGETLQRLYGRFRFPTMLVFDRAGRVASKVIGQPADIVGAIRDAQRGLR